MTGLSYFQDRSVVDGNGCWVWQLGTDRDGYARCHRRNGFGSRRACREVWATQNGPIPDGLTIDHRCRNHACVNPDHLEPVTQAVNNLRALPFIRAKSAAKTRCSNGHEFTAENTYSGPNGRRLCRECAADYARRYRARNRKVAV